MFGSNFVNFLQGDKNMVIEKIQNLLKEQGKDQKDLCQHLNLSKSTFSSWKSGVTNSYMKKLPEIAEYLGVSVEYLLGKEKSPAGAGLKEKHWRLITAYERAEEPIKDAVDRLLKIEDKPVLVKIAARDGSFQEREITQEEWEKIQGLPDANL